MPKVSVIIPVYNVQAYLRQCLDSVVNQTLKDIEIICVDDGSTDGSAAILKEYALKDSRINVLTQANSGAGAARNAGIAVAKGAWLYFVDGDDFIDQHCLLTAVTVGDALKPDIVVFQGEEVDDRFGVRTPMAYLKRVLPWADGCLHQVAEFGENRFVTVGLAPWNKLVRKDAVDSFAIKFQEIRKSNDLAFMTEFLARAKTFVALRNSLIGYRVNNPMSTQATNSADPLLFYDALLEAKRRLGGDFEEAMRLLAVETIRYHLHSVRTFSSYCAVCKHVAARADVDFGVDIALSSWKGRNRICFRFVRSLETLRERGAVFCLQRLIGRVLTCR
jgi:glycosyltransferase involved in cell wall biosynthesis